MELGTYRAAGVADGFANACFAQTRVSLGKDRAMPSGKHVNTIAQIRGIDGWQCLQQL